MVLIRLIIECTWFCHIHYPEILNFIPGCLSIIIQQLSFHDDLLHHCYDISSMYRLLRIFTTLLSPPDAALTRLDMERRSLTPLDELLG